MQNLHKICTVNTVVDCKVENSPILLTQFGNKRIFRVKASTKRTSGVLDYFYVNYSSELGVILHEGDFIFITGDIRTLNKPNSDFVIEGFIYAKSIEFLDKEPESYRNNTEIENAELYKFVDVRKSFTNDKIVVADYQLRLLRGHGRCSYFKATSWGNDAVFLGNIHEGIEYVNIKCRLQNYISKRTGRLYLCLAVYRLEVTKGDNEDKEEVGGDDSNAEGGN